MQGKFARAIALIACVAPLGACSSFLGIRFAQPAHKQRPAASAPTPNVAATATQAGRRQLADGQTGLAIESFRAALSNAEPVAPAVNGLGVAYARLGRFEMALQYFEQARALDPANADYAANLARLMRSPTFAMRRDADLAALAIGTDRAGGAAAGGSAASASAPVAGKLQRVSRGEVRITTVPARTAPLGSATARVDSRFRPLVRVSFAQPAEARAAETPPGAEPAASVDRNFRPLARVEFADPATGTATAGVAGKPDESR